MYSGAATLCPLHVDTPDSSSSAPAALDSENNLKTEQHRELFLAAAYGLYYLDGHDFVRRSFDGRPSFLIAHHRHKVGSFQTTLGSWTILLIHLRKIYVFSFLWIGIRGC